MSSKGRGPLCHVEQLKLLCPQLFGPWEEQHQGSTSVSHIRCSSHCHSWQDTGLAQTCLFCRHEDGVGPSSQPLWPAEGRVIPALVSSLGLCSLRSLAELEGSGYSGIAGAVTTRNSFPAKHLKSITMVQSFVLRHQRSFVLLFQLAVV